MKRLLSLILCLCCFCAISIAQIAGPWHGTVAVGMQKLPLVFNISESGSKYAATMDSPLQGAKDIPTEISVCGDTVCIQIPLIGAKYQGVFDTDVIRGEFSQRGMRFKVDLEPGAYLPPRPQTPQPPFPYETREVTIVNPDDGYHLHGTLTLPIQYVMPRKRDYNAVVMVSGSGTQNRDEEVFGHKPFAVIAHHLALNGVASLRYDDRGYADSIADVTPVTTATNAADAKAAIKYLRDSVERLGKIGVLGHSEGGTVALMLAADGDADFAISLAGTAVRGDSLLITQNQRLLEAQLGPSLTRAYISGLRRTLQYMEDNPSAEQWPEIDEALADLSLPQQLRDNLHAIVSERNPWLDYFLTYDPAQAIRRIAVPVFAANGTLDMQVDCDQNLGAIKASLPDNQNTLIKEYTGLNHLMQEARTGAPSEYGEIEQTISPQLLQDISDWLKALRNHYLYLRVHCTKNVNREATYFGADFVLQTQECSELRD